MVPSGGIERGVEELFDFLFVLGLASSSNGAGWSPSSIVRVLALVVLCLVGGSVDARADVAPCTVVHWLLLAPEKISVGVLIKVGCQEIIREGRNLLNTADGDILDTLLFTLLEKSVIHLASAKNVPLDLFRSDEEVGLDLWDVALEVGLANHLREV